MPKPRWFQLRAQIASLVAATGLVLLSTIFTASPAAAQEPSAAAPAAAKTADVAPKPAGPAAAAVAEPRNNLPGLKNFEQVSDSVSRGAQPSAKGFATLKQRGVKTIVNLRAEHSDRALLAGTGMQYVEIPCNPWKMEEAEVVEFLKVVRDPKNQPVFVHCAYGSDRTGMMIGAYRMLEQNQSIDATLAELHKYGFHSIYTGIVSYLKNFDRAKVQKEIDAAQSPKVERIK
ncbi:MAG TPA: tyrosine-protein phosphatase [Pirellulales bacterium]|nr:tyrosine-protein phosphatase [Pirellulales bacterium]